jgi:hypothetical protein
MITYNCKNIIHNAFPLILCIENAPGDYFRAETPVKRNRRDFGENKKVSDMTGTNYVQTSCYCACFLRQTYQNKNFNKISDLAN